MQPSRSRQMRRRVGMAMMVSSMGLAASMIGLAPAGAQNAGEAETVDLVVSKTAFYTVNVGRATPNNLSDEFPARAVCVVEPQLCPQELRPVFDPIQGVLNGAEDLPTSPQQPVAPGTLPVSIFGGETRYSSALLAEVPAVPAGEEVGTWFLRLAEDPTQTYHSESPAFRQAVLAAFKSIQDGAPNQEEFQKILGEDPVNSAVMGVEACPVISTFEDGPNQPETALPELDCLYGANGTRLDDGTWEFDLSYAAAAWADGTFPNEGVFLRPAAAPNLAFGDPDTSTMAQVAFVPVGTQATIQNQPERQAPAPFTPAPAPPASTTTSPTYSGGSVSAGGISAPTIFPEAAEAASDPAPQPVASAPAPAAAPVLAAAPSAWWVWLLVPIFLAGMYLTAQSLTAEVVLAGERQGAMSRLLAARDGVPVVGGSSAPAPRTGAMTRLVGEI